MAEQSVPDEIPASWLDLATAESGAAVPRTLSEEPPPAGPDGPELDGILAEVLAR
jgi:hypothetical protein